MTRKEARRVFLSRGYVEVEGGTIYDADKWRESCRVISEWLEQEPCDDAISRQAVEKITWEEPSYTDVLNVLTEVREKVRALPPVKPQEPKWIPVSERLPDECDYRTCYEVEDGAVLWTNEDGLVGMGYYYESTKTWSDIEDNPIAVIAWMPLPSPYQPQERSDKE